MTAAELLAEVLDAFEVASEREPLPLAREYLGLGRTIVECVAVRHGLLPIGRGR